MITKQESTTVTTKCTAESITYMCDKCLSNEKTESVMSSTGPGGSCSGGESGHAGWIITENVHLCHTCCCEFRRKYAYDMLKSLRETMGDPGKSILIQEMEPVMSQLY